MDFVPILIGLLVYGSVLFAVTQYFDTKYDSYLEKSKDLIDKDLTVPRQEIRNELGQGKTLGELWGRIKRWDNEPKRLDIIFQVALLISFVPILVLLSNSEGVQKWINSLVKPEHAVSIPESSILLSYELLLFLSSLITLCRIIKQAYSLRNFRAELKSL